MTELELSRGPGPLVDDPSLEELLASLAHLVRTIASSRRGVDDVVQDLSDLAARVIGPDGARVVRRAGTAPGPTSSVRLLSDGQLLGFLELSHPHGQCRSARERAVVVLFAELASSCLALAQERARVAGLTEAWEYRATHDALTGLPNRSLLLDRLEHALLADTRRGSLVAVMYVDIDGFKSVNDTYGHPVGDLVLASVAEGLAEAVRAADTVGRLGGDEFLVICENLTGSRATVDRRLRTLGRRLLRAMAALPTGPAEVAASVSIGAAVGGHPGDAQSLIRSADRALYRAKDLGGGQFVLADSPVVPLAGLGVIPTSRASPTTS